MELVGKYCKGSYLFIALACVAVLFLHQVLNKGVQLKVADPNDALLPSYEAVQLCSGGFERFLSDMYWLAFVQYCGEPCTEKKEIKYRHSYDYVNLITLLDPHFKQPYWFGCWAIGYWQGRTDLADKIMQRGIENNPRDWYMPYLAGVNQFVFAHDTKKAARYYRQAAKLPNAPDYLNRHAELFESSIPEYEKRFRTLWELYFSAKEENLKQSTYVELVRTLKGIYHNAPANAPTVKRGAYDRMKELGLTDQEINQP